MFTEHNASGVNSAINTSYSPTLFRSDKGISFYPMVATTVMDILFNKTMNPDTLLLKQIDRKANKA